jgi:hypothetical protein
MKDLIEIDRGIDFCHEKQTILSRHCVGGGICASPAFLTNCENKKEVLTPLLPIRGAGEFPLNSPCRNVFLSTRKCGEGPGRCGVGSMKEASHFTGHFRKEEILTGYGR